MAEVLDTSNWPVAQDESMGDSAKLWLLDSEGRRWMFKENRPKRSPDEAASEYATAKLAARLNVPAATIKLGVRDDVLGALCLDLIEDATHELVEAQVFLSGTIDGFDPLAKNRIGHNFTNIISILEHTHPPRTAIEETSIATFGSYLLFDALIGNTDRHSGNWAIECSLDQPDWLLPSYDHATSLGITTRDNRRLRLLSGDASLEEFAAKATAHRFENGANTSLVEHAIGFNRRFCSENLLTWATKLEEIRTTEVELILQNSNLSEAGAKLAIMIVEHNRERILKCL